MPIKKKSGKLNGADHKKKRKPNPQQFISKFASKLGKGISPKVTRDPLKGGSKPNGHGRKSSAGEWKPAFLQALRNAPVIRVACMQAGISRKTAYQWRSTDEDFREQWDEALEDGVDTLEAVLLQRARESDTTAAIFLLKSFRPEKYRENAKIIIGGNGGDPIRVKNEHAIAGLDFDKFAVAFQAVMTGNRQDELPPAVETSVETTKQ